MTDEKTERDVLRSLTFAELTEARTSAAETFAHFTLIDEKPYLADGFARYYREVVAEVDRRNAEGI